MVKNHKTQEANHEISGEDYYAEFTRKTTGKIVKLVKIEREPSLWLDATPYFLMPSLFAFCLFVHQYTTSPILGGWIIYVGTPLYNWLLLKDSENLDRESERRFADNLHKSWVFLVPLYFAVIF